MSSNPEVGTIKRQTRAACGCMAAGQIRGRGQWHHFPRPRIWPAAMQPWSADFILGRAHSDEIFRGEWSKSDTAGKSDTSHNN